ncbi:ATP-dependent zinc metalloprotease FtsH [Planctomycetes bacterium Pan216]|uniref:ATP-dependent zinc metalloprotease FtsH n=1 Tax=Kolteria novifilia TaxID=2527975 RepID=A0A518B8D7_9BACT|nr:ATP-dependent zinc metalloprotease FtsH [Planctomycetes bacterium Pan216]
MADPNRSSTNNRPPKPKDSKGDAKRDANPYAGGDQTPPNWRFWIWYAVATLLLLWWWQESFHQMQVKEIPYSQFKAYLAKGEVTKVEIRPETIFGLVIPKTADKSTDGDTTKNKDDKTAKGDEANKADEAKSTAKNTTKPQPPRDLPATAKEKTEKTSSVTDKEASKEASEKPASKTDDKTKSAAKPKEKSTDSIFGISPQSETFDGKKVVPGEFEFVTVRVDDPQLVEELEKQGVDFEGERTGFLTYFLWYWLLPIVVMLLIWSFLIRRMGMAGQSLLNVTQSKARMVVDQQTGVTFGDVAGCDEAKAELTEVVDFLSNPERYELLGAKIPKGVLLVGPPGTGKTLLARAVAGEANVPFFQLSGSDFVEMFVGVGAARVRDLFQQGKRHAPCIIFIDELDAIGRQRGVHVGAVNDEREQTLNQLLVEMDGFDANVGVIILAATNRPEVLDAALLRPGRFDRQVLVDAPDIDGREAILKVHSRNKKIAEDVDLRRVAQATPRYSGADLANVMNEAALLAARFNHEAITQGDLLEAVEKVLAGPERRSRRLLEEERKRVAYHEAGHALVAHFLPHSDPLHKISIVPRGKAALGYTMHVAADDQFLMTRSALVDRIKGLLGGRAAEQVVFGEVSTGAQNDLERATAMAQQMVCMYGMSESVGLNHVAQKQGAEFLGDGAYQRQCSPETSREIDEEIKRLLDQSYHDAVHILSEHREQLEKVSQFLLEKETMESDEFIERVGSRPASEALDPDESDS